MQKSLIKAIGFTKNGDPSVLKYVNIPVPVPTSHELLVEVKAVAVNPIDTKIRIGRRGVAPDVPETNAYGFAG